MVDNIITKYSISSKYRKIMTIIRLNQIGQNEYERIKTINKKLHGPEDNVAITGKIHLLKDSTPSNLGRHLDLAHPVLLCQMF